MQNKFVNISPKTLYIIIGFVVTLLVSFVIYSSMSFHVTGVNPGNNSTITSLTKTIVLSFNKELAPFDRTTQVAGGENILSGSKVDGNNLYLQLSKMEDNTDYTLTLSGITATDGSVISEYVYRFKYNFDPKASSATDKGSNDPLVKYLPVTTDQYYISYQLLDQPTADGKTEKIIIALGLDDVGLADPDMVAQYRRAALDFLDSKGILLSNYVVEYSPPEVAP